MSGWLIRIGIQMYPPSGQLIRIRIVVVFVVVIFVVVVFVIAVFVFVVFVVLILNSSLLKNIHTCICSP